MAIIRVNIFRIILTLLIVLTSFSCSSQDTANAPASHKIICWHGKFYLNDTLITYSKALTTIEAFALKTNNADLLKLTVEINRNKIRQKRFLGFAAITAATGATAILGTLFTIGANFPGNLDLVMGLTGTSLVYTSACLAITSWINAGLKHKRYKKALEMYNNLN